METPRRLAGRAARPLLPPHRQAVQGLGQRAWRHRLRLSRLGIRLLRRLRTDSAGARQPGPCRRPRAGLSRRGEVRLCLGRAGRSAAADSRFPRGRRPRLSPHPAVLRALEHQSAARDGERFRQFALQLRPPCQFRHRRPAQTREIRTDAARMGLRGRDAGADPQYRGWPSGDGHHRADHPPAYVQPLGHALYAPLRLHLSGQRTPSHHLQLRHADRRPTTAR